MTPRIFRSPIFAFCLVVSVSTSMSAGATSAIDEAAGDSAFIASSDGSFVIAQTTGMDRRQNRRTDRQDCRQQNGLVGKDKRDCKQEERTESPQEKEKEKQPPPG